MSNILNGITEAKRSPEPDYNDPSWDEKVSNVGQKAKQAEVLKSKGKEPKTRWNPETKKYYVDFSDVDESVGIPYPGTYEETNDMFKSGGQRRVGTLTTEEDVTEAEEQGIDNKYRRAAKEMINVYNTNPEIKAKVDASTDPLEAMVYTTGVIKNPDRLTGTTHMNKLMTELESIYYYGREQGVAEGSEESYMIIRTDAEGKKDMFAKFSTYEKAQKELDGLLDHPLHTKYKQKFEIKRKGGEQGVAEGLPQILRKVVPGYAKREIDQKMDAEKFGRTDVDRDANYYRYKKIQDKLKEQGMAEAHGNYAGDTPVNLGGVSMKMIQTGDTVKYIDQKAQVVDMSPDRKYSRITIPSSSTTKTVLTSDLRQLGQGVAEEKQRLDPSCWKGYKKQGTKMKGDTRVNNCVPIKESAILKGLRG